MPKYNAFGHVVLDTARGADFTVAAATYRIGASN
jgi:hypothetical protein